MQTDIYKDLAQAFEYPSDETLRSVSLSVQNLRGQPGAKELTGALEGLASYLATSSTGEAQEWYTQLFDLKPVCTLNLGHHIFGDTYARGALLAGLASELNQRGLLHKHELPDYLPTLLILLGAMEDLEDRVQLVHAVILPALRKVNAALKSSDSLWSKLLKALPEWLMTQVPLGEYDVPVPRPTLEVLPC